MYKTESTIRTVDDALEASPIRVFDRAHYMTDAREFQEMFPEIDPMLWENLPVSELVIVLKHKEPDGREILFKYTRPA